MDFEFKVSGAFRGLRLGRVADWSGGLSFVVASSEARCRVYALTGTLQTPWSPHIRIDMISASMSWLVVRLACDDFGPQRTAGPTTSIVDLDPWANCGH